VLLSMSNVTSWRSRATLEYVEQSVFISRVCHELVKQQQLMSLESILAQQRGGPNASTPRGRTSAVSTSAPSSSLSLTLSSTSRTAYRIWTRYIASLVAEDLEVEWEEWWSEMSSLSATTALGTQYEKQLFSNRSHLNGAPPLGLYLPVHPSGFISRLLFRVHHHYYRSYGYHIQSDILQALLTDVDQAVLGVVQGKVGVKKQEGGAGVQKSEDGLKRLSSASVLQLMFDVQFLFALLRLPPSTAASSAAAKAAGGPKALLSDNAAASGDLRTQYSSLLALFDAHLSRSLDQIDWVTSKPTFIANLHAAVTRSAVLYGVMAKTNPFPTTLPAMVSAPGAAPSTSFEALGGGGGGGGGQSAPLAVNIVPLAPVPAKILPLPTSLYPSKHPQPPTATSTISSITATTLPSAATKLALASTLSSSGANGTASHSAASSHSTTASSTGLSFSNLSSNLSSQLSSVNTSAAVNAKAIGDLGSSLLGKLSSSTLWGKKQ
jgi:hypothetical protein